MDDSSNFLEDTVRVPVYDNFVIIEQLYFTFYIGALAVRQQRTMEIKNFVHVLHLIKGGTRI